MALVDSISSATAATNAGALGNSAKSAGASKDLGKLNANFDFFIKMLTAQLKNQDPLDPQDSSKFTEQLVQFSTVEQQIGTNDKLQQILDVSNLNAFNYVGRTVEMGGDSVILKNSQAGITYDLPQSAQNVELKIVNSLGQTLRSLNGGGQKGTHDIFWDGKDSNGTQLPDGSYKFEFVATRDDGANVKSTPRVLGVVDRASRQDGAFVLNIGPRALDIKDVLAVRG